MVNSGSIVRVIVFVGVFVAVALLLEAAGVAIFGGSFEAALSPQRALVAGGIAALIFEVLSRRLASRKAVDGSQEA